MKDSKKGEKKMEWVKILAWPVCTICAFFLISEVSEDYFRYKNKKLDLKKIPNTSSKKENDSPGE